MFRLAEENTNNTTNLCNSSTIDGRSNLIVHVPKKRARLSSSISSMSSCSSDDNTTMSYNSSGTMPPYISLLDIAMLDWQEAQLSRSIVDNAVNLVVESYRTLFESDLSDTPPTEQQLAQVVEVDSDFEESAILMAINEHGLQQHNISNDDDDDNDDLVDTDDDYDDDDDDDGDDDDQKSSAIATKMVTEILFPLPEPRNSPELITDDINLPSVSNTTTFNENRENTSDKNPIDNRCCSDRGDGNDKTNKNTDSVNNDSEEVSDHFSFIETAVAVAIEKKGLTKSL